MKKEINTLHQEIKHKLTVNVNELQTQKAALTEAQTRTAELEEWKADVGDKIRQDSLTYHWKR